MKLECKHCGLFFEQRTLKNISKICGECLAKRKKSQQNKSWRKWYIKNKEKRHEYNKPYNSINAKRKRCFNRIRKIFQDRIMPTIRSVATKQNHKRYRKNNPLKCEARWKTRNAIARGKIIKTDCRCKRFNWECNGTVEAHHWDYYKPLDVEFYCSKHHHIVDKIKIAIDERKQINV